LGRVSRGQHTGRLRRLAGSRCARTRTQRSATPTVILLVCLLVATSCSGDDEEADATPSRDTTTTERETTTTLDPEQVEREAVIAAHEAASEARLASAAAPTPDPEHPDLLATHTDFMLERWQTTVTGLQLNGWAFRRPEGSQSRTEVDDVRFDEVDGQRVAYLEVCDVSDTERYIVATGQVLSSGVLTVQATEAMRQVDGVWMLAERRENSEDEGVVGCAADS
jgi:hypothetical protein